MLRELRIENIAVIERADIVFDTGLNVMTGETGAGKSIVIDSIAAVTGSGKALTGLLLRQFLTWLMRKTGFAKTTLTAMIRS